VLNGLIIAGPLRGGKTTTADALLKAMGYGEKLSFATALKLEVAQACSKDDREAVQFYDEMLNPDTKAFWRVILQWWGTELRRERYAADYWVTQLDNYIEEQLEADPNRFFVSDDCRFPNELEMLRRHGFAFAMLEGQPLAAEDAGIPGHQSEDLASLGEPDLYIPWMPVQARVEKLLSYFEIQPSLYALAS
jgi:hypothetical protein